MMTAAGGFRRTANVNEETPQGSNTDWTGGLSPRQVIETIIERGDPKTWGLSPYIEAVWYARLQGWDKLEMEQYVKLGALLDQLEGELDGDVADGLCRQIARTELTEDIDTVLWVLLKAMEHLPAESLCLFDIMDVLEDRMKQPSTAWKTRLLAGEFLDRLERLDACLAESRRRRLASYLAEWALDYHAAEAGGEFPMRSRAIFTALLAAAWSEDSAENVERGLDGAFLCTVDKLMEGTRSDWLGPFLEHLSGQLGGTQMYRRLSRETLYRIGETLTRARRLIYEHDPDKALAITALEEAIHRPHRLMVAGGPVSLELELPGARGFGGGIRLQVHDISRDGCLAVLREPAHFDETAPGEEFPLERGPGRTYPVRRLTGVLRRQQGALPIRVGTELILHDTCKNDREWATIDSASLVRFTTEGDGDRTWFGFHFDRVLPEVQQELEQLVYSAA